MRVSLASIAFWIFCVCSGGAGSDTNQATIDLRGRVVCLSEEMNAKYGAVIPTNHEHLWGFKTIESKYYTLIRTKSSIALFLDERLRQKDLLLTGRIFPNSQVFEAQHLRSVKDGKICELFYYCDVCAIESITPEICQCCREPVRLVEGKP